MTIENLIYIMDLVTSSAFHFISSGFAGALVFLLTQTISSDAFQTSLGRVPLARGRKYFMVGLALCLALLSALAAHVLLDTVTTAWIAPQGPPIHIILKPNT